VRNGGTEGVGGVFTTRLEILQPRGPIRRLRLRSRLIGGRETSPPPGRPCFGASCGLRDFGGFSGLTLTVEPRCVTPGQRHCNHEDCDVD